jgi:hypothetical protein
MEYGGGEGEGGEGGEGGEERCHRVWGWLTETSHCLPSNQL